MQVHPRLRMRPFGHDARDQWYLFFEQFMCHPLHGDGVNEWIGHYNFLFAQGGWIAIKGGFDVSLQDFPDARKISQEVQREFTRRTTKILRLQFRWATVFQTFVNFVFEPPENGVHQGRCDDSYFGRMNRRLIKEPGKQQAQQIYRNRGNGSFGWQVPSVQMINAARPGVGSN
jgi:hypothetical protein